MSTVRAWMRNTLAIVFLCLQVSNALANSIRVELPFFQGFLKHSTVHSNNNIQTLADTGFYALENERILFEPQYPLWTNGLRKRRWIYLPPGEKVDNSQAMDFRFPVGTKFWKDFYDVVEVGSTTKEIKIETRYLEKTNIGWQMLTFQWNQSQQLAETDAQLAPLYGVPNAYLLQNGRHHAIPSRYACRSCHSGGFDVALGMNALQISDHLDEPRENPNAIGLSGLYEKNKLMFPVGEADVQPRILAKTIASKKAMGYLQGNCAGCHRPNGNAGYTELWFEVNPDLEEDQQSVAQAMNRQSNYLIPGHELESYQIRAGIPEQSAIWYRLQTLVPGDQMPPLGVAMIDESGVQKILNWIKTLGGGKYE